MIRPTKRMIDVDALMEEAFSAALPPIVKNAIIPNTTIETTEVGTSGYVRLMSRMIGAAATPLIVPQMSPTISLQMLLTLPALRTMATASRAPGTLSAAIALKGASSPAVAA